jgi:hypothetical protein
MCVGESSLDEAAIILRNGGCSLADNILPELGNLITKYSRQFHIMVKTVFTYLMDPLV